MVFNRRCAQLVGGNTMDIFEHVEAMISAIALTVACAAVVQIIAHIN